MAIGNSYTFIHYFNNKQEAQTIKFEKYPKGSTLWAIAKDMLNYGGKSVSVEHENGSHILSVTRD